MISIVLPLVIIVIFIILIFTLTNGLHDVSSIIATMISCGAAPPEQAIILVSIFGLLGSLLGGNAVANNIIKLINVKLGYSILKVLLVALLGAIIWNLATYYLGIPSSSTHSLIGGLIGSTWIAYGKNSILWGVKDLLNNHEIVGIIQVFISLIISPLIGFVLAFIIQKVMLIFLRNAKCSINKLIKRLNWIMVSVLAFSYGANHTQKLIGIIMLVLMSGGILTEQIIPLWLKLILGIVLFSGTFFGGWSIIKTLGRKIFTIRPIHSLNSQISAGTSILLFTILGAPVSSTHVIVGSVMGVGSADEYKMVNWSIGKEMIFAWFLTIPASGIVSSLLYYPIFYLFKVI